MTLRRLFADAHRAMGDVGAARGAITASFAAHRRSSVLPEGSSASEPCAEDRLPHLHYRPRWRYAFPFRSMRLHDFIVCQEAHAVSLAHTYAHPTHDVTVTLIPLRHFAHPQFFSQVDDLCCQHESVLMEGRVPLSGSPYSTLVPPRARLGAVRPVDHEDDEGWEPVEMERFFQPFSWGVRESPVHTVIHAADQYDYERLPWWCSVRFSAPVLGSLSRERHCLNMLYPLRANGYRSFAIPWGAAHMPVFHEMLADNGFELVGVSSLLLLQRVDGNVSEGEFARLRRWSKGPERRRRCWQSISFCGLLAVLYRHMTVDYSTRPHTE